MVSQLQTEPRSLADLQESYARLYSQSWMGEHVNVEQSHKMLDFLEPVAGRTFLDIGCGTGYTVHLALERGLDAFGVDLSAAAIQQGVEKYDLGARLSLCAAESLPWPNRSFDYVSILGSLEHFLDPAGAVREVVRILRPGGKAAILVPNSHHLRAIYNVLKYGEILSDLQDYERFATRREWERLFAGNGLRVDGVYRHDTGMARIYRPGREIFWFVYNALFRLLRDRWIPFNLAYTFIFICSPAASAD